MPDPVSWSRTDGDVDRVLRERYGTDRFDRERQQAAGEITGIVSGNEGRRHPTRPRTSWPLAARD